MKFHMFSIVVGSTACPGSCPFCVSGELPTKERCELPEITPIQWRKFESAKAIAIKSGVDTVMFTSRGETTIWPDEISAYMERIGHSYNFPFIELQTNGLMLDGSWERYKPYLEKWFMGGMTTIALSTVSEQYSINRDVYYPNGLYLDLKGLIEKLHTIGFTVRLTCVMCKGWMDTTLKVESYLEYAKKNNVEQVTMRPLNDEYRRESAANWIKEHKMTDKQQMEIWNWLNKEGTALLEYPRVGTIFDFNGQNVMFSKPLTKYTRDTNPENGRNLIFFRDGRVAYEWEMEGGTLL